MQTESDDQLEHNVHNAFMQFGACYVKIRRDAQGMPFAFVQYEVRHCAIDEKVKLIPSERERCSARYHTGPWYAHQRSSMPYGGSQSQS